MGISNISLDLPLSSLGSIKESLALFNFTGEGSSFALRDADLLSDLSLGSGFIFEKLDGFLQLGLVSLDRLQSLSIGFVGMIQSNLKLVDFSLELLLNAKSFSLGTLFSFNGSSERVHSAGMILPGIVELIFSLSNTSVNVLSNLSEFKLSTENLVLLHLKSSLGFLQSGLEFFLFSFKSSALLVQIVDGSSTISKLVKEILDFISKILVLALDNIKSFSRFGLSSLKSEQFRAVVPSFILRSGDFSGNIGCLGLPFTKDLVKVLGSLLGDQGSSMDTLVLHGNVIQIG